MASLPLSSSADESTWPPLIAVRSPRVESMAARLSQLEWSVVAMAERDSVASLREPTRLANLLRTIFGMSRATPLANDRLEALRRVAVHAWRNRWNVPKSELRVFIEQGFSMDQFELLQTRISQAIATSRFKGRIR